MQSIRGSLLLIGMALAIPLYHVYRVPVVGKLLRLALPISMEPKARWRWLDTFDWYTPKYQWKYLYPEIFRWFRDNRAPLANNPRKLDAST